MEQTYLSNKNTLCSWSGGKDSCFALMRSIKSGFEPKVLLNVLNEEGKISRSHGIPSGILEAQSKASGIPLKMISSSWEDYEKKFTTSLIELKKEFDLTYAVFGDIDLQAHRDWEEKVCGNAGLEAILPLWKENRKELVLEMLDAGIETVIVSCNEKMGKNFIGRKIGKALVEELDLMGIDPCGENGEYHTLVINCPLFDKRINVRIDSSVLHNNYWFGEIVLQLEVT
jgi:diphthine-ammonia ligase